MMTYNIHHHRNGFSLVEVLAVIGVIAILVAIATPRMLPPRPITAARMVSGVIEATRVEAIQSGSRSRIAVNIDPSNELYLQQVVSLIDHDGKESTQDWRITSKNVFPAGTVLLKDFTGPLSGGDQEMKLDPTNLTLQDGSSGESFFYQQFDSLGQCESSSQWIFSRGEVEDGTVTYINERDRDGFIIRKTGKTTYFAQPDQITPLGSY